MKFKKTSFVFLFCRNGKPDPKIHIELQGVLKTQKNLEKNNIVVTVTQNNVLNAPELYILKW